MVSVACMCTTPSLQSGEPRRLKRPSVEYLITDWLGSSVGWIPYVSTADVMTVAPFLIAAAILLAAISSLVTLSRYTKV